MGNEEALEKETILSSRLATKVLAEVTESPSYTKEIADSLNKSPQSISRILRGLKEIQAVKTVKRDQAKYYEANFQGLALYSFDKLRKALKQSEKYETEEIDRFRQVSIRFLEDYYRSLFHIISSDDPHTSVLHSSEPKLDYLLFESILDQVHMENIKIDTEYPFLLSLTNGIELFLEIDNVDFVLKDLLDEEYSDIDYSRFYED